MCSLSNITTSRFILARVVADKTRMSDVITLGMSRFFHSRESGPAECSLILSTVNVVCILVRSNCLFVNNRTKSRGNSRKHRKIALFTEGSRAFIFTAFCDMQYEANFTTRIFGSSNPTRYRRVSITPFS